MSTYFYEHTYVYPISMSTFKILSWFDVKIHEVSHKKHLVIDRDIASPWKNN
jgi:hypothetical protein